MAPSKGRHTPRHKQAQNPPTSAAAGILSEAGRLKHQAERRPEGVTREPLLEQCAKLLEQALTLPLSSHEEEEAFFDLGGVYALWGNSVQAGMYPTVGSLFNRNITKVDALNMQLDALLRSANLYRQSHEMYEKIASRGVTELKQEAMINSGNSLCDWADLSIELPANRGGGATAAANLCMQADLRYSAALSCAPDDIELLTNLGDCNIKRAELAVLVGSGSSPEIDAWTAAKALYKKAMDAYGDACGLVDASKGDDFAGLLQNWGAGLLSLAERSPDIAEATVAFQHAQEKFRTAAKFRPTDVSIFIALGEACSTQAEQLGKDSQFQAQALDLLVCAIEEGFGGALKVDARCFDAIIGKGEAHLAAGKIASCIGRHSLTEEHFTQGLSSYMKAVQILEADTICECKLKFEEQCNVLFNLGCVAALCNQEAVAANALTRLVQVEGISASELAEDSDLQSLKTKDWFLALLQKAS